MKIFIAPDLIIPHGRVWLNNFNIECFTESKLNLFFIPVYNLTNPSNVDYIVLFYKHFLVYYAVWYIFFGALRVTKEAITFTRDRVDL